MLQQDPAVGCFPGWVSGNISIKRTLSAKKSLPKEKEAHFGSLSPASSIDRDEIIRAHRGVGSDLEEAARRSDPLRVDGLTELAKERMLRQNAEAQLASALGVNAELKLAVALAQEELVKKEDKRVTRMQRQLVKERGKREELTNSLLIAQRELGAVKAALKTVREQRDALEAELMEAAFDVLEGKQQHQSLQASMKHERQLRAMAEASMLESEELRARLASAEAARDSLEARLSRTNAESQNWEAALDALQDQLENALVVHPLDASSIDCGSSKDLESGSDSPRRL